ncbi:MAG: hypothetical protein ACXWQQ_09165, partial [Pseudobdellovibrio sp.]
MTKLLLIATALTSLIFFTNCKKSDPTDTSSNIATSVVSNLAVISNGYTPASLSSNTSSAVTQSDPCANTTDFAVCQSNLIREYIRIGKSAVDGVSEMASQIGAALGQIPDGNSGTSTDGKISWNKTSSEVWSILSRGTGGNSLAYFSVNNGVYTLKVDANNAETNPQDQQIEANITFTSASDWTVDIYFGNNVCNAAKVSDPSKAHIKLTKANGLWTGKAMLYVPHWQTPGTATATCSTNNTIAMYTEFVGNDTSTKAAIYMIPTTENNVNNITSGNYALPQFCSNFPGACGSGAGQIPSSFLNAYPNNWC